MQETNQSDSTEHVCNKCGKSSKFDNSKRFLVCCNCNYAFDLYNIEDHDPILLQSEHKNK